MTIKDRHNSMRGWFAYELYQQMKKNNNIWLLVGDLGYKVFDKIRDDFPYRFVNTGAAEQAMMDIAVGLALKGKIPFVYSITPFLIWRPAEMIRLYVNHENISVKMIVSGRDKDYEKDGFSHDATDVKPLLDLWPNIKQYWPIQSKELPELVDEIINNNKPCFLSLRR